MPWALCILLFGLLPAPWASAQVAVPNTAFTYLQDFNTLATTGTDIVWSNNTTLAGWFLFRQPASSPVAITTYIAST
ncbi:MAG TPA: hypothetical protein PKD70_15885, partial [Saprospiraceae bacterium]|nr:hypothetical protein [Saprospiraceae bacterium]